MRLKKICGAVLLIAGVLAVLGGCDFSDEHEHAYSKWAITKAPGCVDSGVQSRECQECGYIESESIAALGHSTVKDPAVKATCTEEGLTEGSHCGVCGEVLRAQEPIAPHGHAALVDYAIKATCTTEGLTEGNHCAICGLVLVKQETIPATGHQYDNVTVVTPANCMQLGTKRYACIYCDTSYLDTYSTTEHTPVTDQAVPAGCTTTGLTQGSHCSVCDLVFTEQVVIPATGHAPVVDAAVNATCTAEGLTEGSHCKTCQEILTAQEAIPALGHQNTEEILWEATCKVPGKKQYTCQVCGAVSQELYDLPAYTDKELYNAAVQYVAEIVTFDKNGNVFGNGIGFVLSSDGKIVTNYQTIAGAYSAQVTVNGATYSVTLVLSYNESADLAVLQVDAADLVAAKLCTEEIEIGQVVYAIAAARGLNNTYTQGAALNPAQQANGVWIIQHDATVSASNSGGPLMNICGEVIGINSFAMSQANGKHLAVSVAQLELLDYSQPVTMDQLYDQNTSAYQKLVDTIFANGSKDASGNTIVYGSYSEGDTFCIYELMVSAADGKVYIKQYNKSNNGQQVDITICLTGEAGPQTYTGAFLINNKAYNQIAGTLDAATYTQASELTYESYEGMKGYESTLLNLYRPNVNRAISWLATYVSEHVGITIADLGFSAFTN